MFVFEFAVLVKVRMHENSILVARTTPTRVRKLKTNIIKSKKEMTKRRPRPFFLSWCSSVSLSK